MAFLRGASQITSNITLSWSQEKEALWFDKGYAGVMCKLHVSHFSMSPLLLISPVFTKLHGLAVPLKFICLAEYWIPWTVVYPCMLIKEEKKKSNSRRILLLMECHYNFVIKKLLTYIIYTQKRKWYCRRPISC